MHYYQKMENSNQKKLFIKTYGCQMNEYDSGRMKDLLQPLGYTAAEGPEDADLVILNTCHIREKAAEKVYSELGRIRLEKDRLKQEGRNMLIAVAGCVAQAEGKEIISRAPYVDIVIGPQAYQRLPMMVANAQKAIGDRVNLDFSPVEKFDNLPEDSSSKGISAFLTIQEGCDKFCTFCVVPYTRGAEFSRPVAEIYREAIRLVSGGARELYLLGQNVNAYHGQGPDGNSWNLAKLIKHLAKINGVERIRYTTSHPRDMDDELISTHAEVEQLMPFIHLPVQSGSDVILKKMNRGHTADFYRKIIDKIRKTRPDIAFSSDFIAGFPGETDDDFKDTIRLVENIGYASAYSFKYSPRPGTPAANQEDQIAESVKDQRLLELQALIKKQQDEFNRSKLGQVLPVLFEKPGRNNGQITGRSPYMQSVHIRESNDFCGRVANVEIIDILPNSLAGKVITN